jgi:hypothetical protein
MLRIGGIALLIMGGVIGLIGYALGLAILGQPVPALPGLDRLQPIFAAMAEAAAVPAGSGWDALPASGSGVGALAGMAAGVAVIAAGLWQVLTGRPTVVGLVLALMVVAGAAYVLSP